MALSQTLMLTVFPPEKRGMAMGLWAMTTLLGPAFGPIIGGFISDNYSWHWIFLINLPIAFGCVVAGRLLLTPLETQTRKVPIDAIGLALLIFWIGSLQIMLDIGANEDGLTRPEIGDLRFLEIRNHVHGLQRHHRHQRRSRAHQLAHLHLAIADHAIDRRAHDRALEIKFGGAQIRARRLHRRVGRFHPRARLT